MENTQTIEKKGNILGWEKIGKLLLKFSVPGIVAMVVNSLYNMVDQIFIGQKVGELGNSATVVLFPVNIICLAVFLLISDGTASLMSLMLGRKNEKEAANGVAAGITGAFIAGIVICTVFQIFLKPFCRLFGATDNIMEYALGYGRIIVWGVPFFAIAVGFAGFIRADGSPSYNMIGLVVGCVTNILLDWLFVVVFEWGVKGAAIATVIGQFINAVIYFVYLFRLKTIKLGKENFKQCFHSFPEIFKLGLSSFINQAVLVILVVAQNNVLKHYGPTSGYGEEIPMTALGVTMKLFNIVMAVVIGLCSGAQPIFGYNYGSGDMKRVKKTFLYTNIIAFATMTFAFLLFQIFPYQIISIFGKKNDLYVEFSVKCLRLHLMTLPLMSIKFVMTAFLQSIGYPVWAAIVSLSRQIIFQFPFLICLPMAIGVDGVLWAGPIADVLTFILCFAILFFGRKKFFHAKSKKDSSYEQAEQKEEEKVNQFAVEGHKDENETSNINSESKGDVIKNILGGKNYAITIGRYYGAGGRSIGKAIAQKLGISYYDKSILKMAAQKSGLSESFLDAGDEKACNEPLNANGGFTSWQSTDEAYYYKESELAKIGAMIEVASKGPCVMVGRRSDRVLKDSEIVYSVFISASMKKRVERVQHRENLTKKEATDKIKKIDKERAVYYNQDGGQKWGRVENYDLVLDCTSLDADSASDIIIDAFIKNIK